jgi:hypothetical protein
LASAVFPGFRVHTVGTRKGSVRFFDKMRGLETIGATTLAAALLGLFSFRLSHSGINKSFYKRVVKSSVLLIISFKKIQNDEANIKMIVPKITRYQTNKPSP